MILINSLLHFPKYSRLKYFKLEKVFKTKNYTVHFVRICSLMLINLDRLKRYV